MLGYFINQVERGAINTLETHTSGIIWEGQLILKQREYIDRLQKLYDSFDLED
jgi:hypothetical protein